MYQYRTYLLPNTTVGTVLCASGACSLNDGHDRQERIKLTYVRKGAEQRRLELQKYNYVVTQFSHAWS